MYIQLSFQIYGHHGGVGGVQVVNAQNYVYYLESDIAKIFPSDLPLVLMILREKKKSKSEPKRTRIESEHIVANLD